MHLKAGLPLGPGQECIPTEPSGAGGQPSQGSSLLGGDDPGEGAQHLLHLSRCDRAIAVEIKHAKQRMQVMTHRHNSESSRL